MLGKLISLLVGIIIFSVLPLLGWGISDFSGFAGQTPRLAFIIAMALLSLWVVIFIPMEGRSRGEGVNPDRSHKISLLMLQVFPLLLVIGAPLSDRHDWLALPESEAWRYAGLIFAIAGFIIMNLSALELGRQFSTDVTLQEGHRLITTGPYRFVRHPRYSGTLLFLCGISLVFLSGAALLLTLLCLLVLLWRVRDEEKMMHAQFGAEWEAYKKGSKALVPFLW